MSAKKRYRAIVERANAQGLNVFLVITAQPATRVADALSTRHNAMEIWPDAGSSDLNIVLTAAEDGLRERAVVQR